MDNLTQIDLWRRFFRPAELASWVMLAVGLALSFFLPLDAEEYMHVILVGALIVAYNLFFFRWLVPNFGSHRAVPYIGQLGSIAIVTAAVYLLEHHGIHVHLLYVIVVAVTGILSGWRLAMLAALLATIAYEFVLAWTDLSVLSVLAAGFHFLVFLMAGFLTSSLAGIIRQQGRAVAQRNRDLALLLDTVSTASASLDLGATLPVLAEKLARELPATFCRICLLDAEGRHLVTRGVFPLRPLAGWQPGSEQGCALDGLYRSQEALATGQVVVVVQDDPNLAMSEAERAALFFDGIKSACLVPLMSQGRRLGLISIGEARGSEREPFGREKADLLRTIAAQLAVVVDNAHNFSLVEDTARRDSLTGALNHKHLLNEIQNALERGRQAEKPVSLIMLDIDFFKRYNDAYGHVMGDEVLRLAVQAIRAHLKRTDVVGRWGGEEFGIVLPGATPEQAQGVAKRIAETLEGLPLEDQQGRALPKPTLSQGIATFPDHADDVEHLVEAADKAMYRAKDGGRDQIAFAVKGE